MAKLTYAKLIENDQRAHALADLGLRLKQINTSLLMPHLVDLVLLEHLILLAES